MVNASLTRCPNIEDAAHNSARVHVPWMSAAVTRVNRSPHMEAVGIEGDLLVGMMRMVADTLEVGRRSGRYCVEEVLRSLRRHPALRVRLMVRLAIVEFLEAEEPVIRGRCCPIGSKLLLLQLRPVAVATVAAASCAGGTVVGVVVVVCCSLLCLLLLLVPLLLLGVLLVC